MIIRRELARGDRRPSARRWAIWSLEPKAITFLLATDLVAAVLAALAIGSMRPTSADLGRLGLLVLLSATFSEASDRIERFRRFLASDGTLSNQNTVLCFAGVLILPMGAAVLLVVAVYGHNLLRIERQKAARPHRFLFSTATVLIGTVAASALYHRLGGQLEHVGALGALTVLGTLLVYTGTSLVVLLAGMYLAARPPSVRVLLPKPDHISYELSTLVLGALAAVIVLRAPWLSPFVLVLAAVLHRGSKVRELQAAARTDAKTGLLNAGSWRETAGQQLAHCVRTDAPAAVLLLDLDHFKAINDNHGHLTGDAVLVAVAQAIKQELRGYDAVGRFGGEEFAVLLGDADLPAAALIAGRLRARIAELEPRPGIKITASIGLADRTGSAPLDELLERADASLYAAKAHGRNRVGLPV